MASDKDLERFASGKDNWNSWAVNERAQAAAESRAPIATNFSGHEFRSSANFSGYIFPGGANFAGAIFRDKADFTSARFSGSTYAERACFDDCRFEGQAEFYEATFSGMATFKRAKFSDETIFTRCSFSDEARFLRSQFLGQVNFWEAEFVSNGQFEEAEFHRRVEFTQAVFKKLALFTGAVFSSGSTFEKTTYAHPPNFLSTVFAVPPLMIGATVDYPTGKERWHKVFGKADMNDDVAKYRRLKQLAQESRDHESTLRFLGQELKAKRFYETKGLSLIPNMLYGILSNFGQSVARPLLWLLLFVIVPAIYYTAHSYPWSAGVRPMGALKCGIYLSVTASGYLVGWEKLLFHQKSLACLGLASSSATGQTLAAFPIEIFFMLQSAITLLLVFLTGLALRNRFRMGSDSN